MYSHKENRDAVRLQSNSLKKIVDKINAKITLIEPKEIDYTKLLELCKKSCQTNS